MRLRSLIVAALTAVMLFSDAAMQIGFAQGKRQPDSVRPRDVRSRNFVLHTDLNDKDAEELLERLETMLKLISSYWGQPNRKIIECYVVKDLKNWPPNSLSQNFQLTSLLLARWVKPMQDRTITRLMR